jgi:acetyl esterase/lipase
MSDAPAMGRPPPAPVVRYGAHPDQVANLHLPAGDPPFPVVALLHGGFWRDRWDRTLMTPLAIDLARRGFAAWNIEYRRVGQEGGGWPGTLDDVRAALGALASVPEIDATRAVAVGHSAGGHLALWAAARCRDPRLAGVVGLAAVTDLELARRTNADAIDGFVGGSPAEMPDRYAEASPRALLPLGVPQVLVHGAADDVVPAELSESYAAAARAAGDDAELVLVAGSDHFDVVDPEHDAWQAVVARLERLLRRR